MRTVFKGIRSTSADFVHNFEKTNLTVRTGVFVDRISLEQKNGERKYKAVGVEAHDDVRGEPIIVKARKEIIISAGWVKRIKFESISSINTDEKESYLLCNSELSTLVRINSYIGTFFNVSTLSLRMLIISIQCL